jgi:hypothetical protein
MSFDKRRSVEIMKIVAPVMLACGFSAAGCFAPPARTSGPTEAQGVQMAIVSQYCEDTDEPDYEGFEAVQLRMKIAVTNRTSNCIGFDPDRLRIVAPDRVAPAPVAADSPLVLSPGETKIAAVRFMNRGSLKCREEMQLDPSDSLMAADKTLPLRPIAFVAKKGS